MSNESVSIPSRPHSTDSRASTSLGRQPPSQAPRATGSLRLARNNSNTSALSEVRATRNASDALSPKVVDIRSLFKFGVGDTSPRLEAIRELMQKETLCLDY
jgi:hypothetical protein